MFAGAQHEIDQDAGQLLGCDVRGFGCGWLPGRDLR